MPTHPETEASIHELIRSRWSPVAFRPEAVSQEKLLSLLEAARWAASSRNEQPWSYIVAHREDTASFERLMSCLAAGNVPWARNAGVLLLSVAKATFNHNGSANRHAWYDVGQATAYLVLEAVHQGLAAHQMAGFDPEKAKTECRIPEGHEAVSMIAVGHHGLLESLPEKLKERESATRARRSIHDFAFRGVFGTPLSPD